LGNRKSTSVILIASIVAFNATEYAAAIQLAYSASLGTNTEIVYQNEAFLACGATVDCCTTAAKRNVATNARVTKQSLR